MLTQEAIDQLTDAVAGPVFIPGSPGFDEEVFSYNVATVHRPDVAVGVTDASDVAAAVRWARDNAVPVGVQATGHGANLAMDGGLLISTRRMQDLQIDAEARTARLGAGVKWRTVIAASVPLRLIPLHGSSTDVGAVGYTLGGGLPVLGRAHGFSADHVRRFEVVTPDGEQRIVDAEHEPELFGLLRGGKGNFAIVTAMTIELLPLGDFYGGGLMYPGDEAARVLDAFRNWVPTLPEHAATSISLLRLPDMDIVPEPLRNQFVVHLRFAYEGPTAEAERLLAPMRAVVTPLMDVAAPMDYLNIDMVHMDPPEPVPYEESGMLLRDFDEAVQEVLLEQAGPQTQSPLLMIELRPMGGALARSVTAPDAISGRDAGYSLLMIGMLVPPIAAVVPAAMLAIQEALAPHATGYTMVNFHGRPGDSADRARAWSPEILERLSRAKASYDPTNMLRFGHALLV